MSLLRRIGTSRNNIDWYNASSNSSGKYLRRTSTGRNNISWLQVSTSGTYNILNRTSTGRNNIQWKNTVFNFGGDLTKYKNLFSDKIGDATYHAYWGSANTSNYYYIGTINRNGYSNISRVYNYKDYDADTSTIVIYYQGTSTAQNVYNEIFKFKTITISGWQNNGTSFSESGTIISGSHPDSGDVGIKAYSYSDGSSGVVIDCYYTIYPGQYPTISTITFS